MKRQASRRRLMSDAERDRLLAEGRGEIIRLFDFAVDRMHERGIGMNYEPSSVDWFVLQSQWRESVNPIHCLRRNWHQSVADVIENLLLERRLSAGSRLFI